MKQITRTGKQSGRGISRGLKLAGAFLLRESKKQVPVDIVGNLKASGFVRAEDSAEKTKVTVGYTAAYAIYVHENLDAAHGVHFNEKHKDEINAEAEHLRGFGQKAKFLEDPYKENIKTMQYIVAKEMMRDIKSS